MRSLELSEIGHTFLWLPVNLGAIIGSFLYDILIGWHFKTEGQAKDENENKKKAIEEVITK